MNTSLSELLELFRREVEEYVSSSEVNTGFCPAFSDGNPNDMPCTCPKTKQIILGEESLLCHADHCPVMIVIHQIQSSN